MLQRPDNFRLNIHSPLANGLVFAGLGAMAGSTLYADSSVYGTSAFSVSPEWSVLAGRKCINYGTGVYSRTTGNFTQGVVGTAMCLCTRTNNSQSYASAFQGGYDSAGQFAIGMSSGTNLLWRINASAKQVASGTLSTTETAHLTLRWNTLDWAAFKNGVALFDEAHSQSLAVISNKYLSIGATRPGVGYYWTGNIADCLLYNRYCSNAEISELADPSNVMLSGLILPPTRKLWPVATSETPATFKPFWANFATQVAI